MNSDYSVRGRRLFLYFWVQEEREVAYLQVGGNGNSVKCIIHLCSQATRKLNYKYLHGQIFTNLLNLNLNQLSQNLFNLIRGLLNI